MGDLFSGFFDKDTAVCLARVACTINNSSSYYYSSSVSPRLSGLPATALTQRDREQMCMS
jgi:hypothetical protein